jgi:hypothetical protein
VEQLRTERNLGFLDDDPWHNSAGRGLNRHHYCCGAAESFSIHVSITPEPIRCTWTDPELFPVFHTVGRVYFGYKLRQTEVLAPKSNRKINETKEQGNQHQNNE